jgi:phosphoglycerol transferase
MQTTKETTVWNKVGRIAAMVAVCILLLLGFLSFFSAAWYVKVYGRIGFDSVLYTLTGGLGGVSTDLVNRYLTDAALPALVFTLCSMVLLFLQGRPLLRIRNITLYPFNRWVSGILAVALSVGLLVHAAFNVELVDYVVNTNRTGLIYQDEYKDPKEVYIEFPKQKRNLIYIMLESMETSYLDKGMGGALDYNLIPELTKLAQDNINFSHNEYVGGFREVTGTSWTIGAMVGHTSGVHLKVPDGIADWQNGYGSDGEFLPGVTSITSILKEQGYNQALMVGSDVKFGGRKTYYESHGIDNIYDLYTAWYDGTVETGYWNNWWGFEDEILYDYAKSTISEMAQQDQPFAFTMLTVDTHHIGGYKCSQCVNEHPEQYENVISCASRQVYKFVQWIMQQPIYENTTIVITGDHCSMDRGYFSRNVEEGYERHVYNCFINAAADPVNTQNRQFCTLDMFPTTLAAMGCTIGGDRLGLGTNLFSARNTLMEEMGYSRLCAELSKKSQYYSDHFYGEIKEVIPTTAPTTTSP